MMGILVYEMEQINCLDSEFISITLHWSLITNIPNLHETTEMHFHADLSLQATSGANS